MPLLHHLSNLLEAAEARQNMGKVKPFLLTEAIFECHFGGLHDQGNGLILP
jgi:hypothetical protein